MNQSIIEIAKEFVNAKNGGKVFEGFLIGEVISPPPEVRVQIDPAIILDKTLMIFSAHILEGYKREFEIYEDTEDKVPTEITLEGSPPRLFTATGSIKWTDTIKIGDKLILVPSANDDVYIVIDKAVQL